MTRWVLALGGFAALLSAACETTEPRWILRFSDSVNPAAARVIRGQILEGGCGGEVLHDVTLRQDDEAGLLTMPPTLERRRYGFAGQAIDDNCVIIAEGCVEIDLPTDEIVVPLDPAGAVSVCPGTTCAQGECNENAVVDVATGRAHSCAVDYGGRLYCWGRNENGQVGDGTLEETRSTPVLIDEGLRISAMSAGGTDGWRSHTCAIENNEVMCWGYNADGQVGDGTREDRVRPVRIGIEATDVSAGGQHTCAVLTNGGDVWCWGNNAMGQLGIQTDEDRVLVPTATDVGSGVQVETGHEFTCVRPISGRIQCAGRNDQGQLGRGDFQDRRRFGNGFLSLDAPSDIAAGGEHACAVDQNGAVWCWGSNSFGQLGTPAGEPVPRPQQVPGIDDAVEVAAGAEFTCVRRRGGAVVCFGYNVFRERGGGADLGDERNALLGVDDAFALSLGTNHGCVIRENGDLFCWGQAQHGRLGNGEVASVVGGFAPTRVSLAGGYMEEEALPDAGAPDI